MLKFENRRYFEGMILGKKWKKKIGGPSPEINRRVLGKKIIKKKS